MNNEQRSRENNMENNEERNNIYLVKLDPNFPYGNNK